MGRPRKPCSANPDLNPECSCVVCRKREVDRDRMNRRYRANPVAINAQQKKSASKWRVRNAEKLQRYRTEGATRAYHAAYYQHHTMEFADRGRAWYAANREKAQLQAYNTKLRHLPPELQEMRRLVRDFKRWCVANSDRATALKRGSAPHAE